MLQAQGDLGNRIRGAVDDMVAGALAPARAQLQEEVAQMKQERLALEGQLQNARSGGERREIQMRMERIDRRLPEVERALQQIERQISTRDGPRTFTGTAPAQSFPGPRTPPFDPLPLVATVLGILFIGFPLALTTARLIWRKATHIGAPAPALTVETTRRFDRLEQSVDAIAIEVERISENQRYLTKVLAESKQSAKIGS